MGEHCRRDRCLGHGQGGACCRRSLRWGFAWHGTAYQGQYGADRDRFGTRRDADVGEYAIGRRFELDGGLVGLDLCDGLAGDHRVAGFLEPRRQRCRRHRLGQLRQGYFDERRLGIGGRLRRAGPCLLANDGQEGADLHVPGAGGDANVQDAVGGCFELDGGLVGFDLGDRLSRGHRVAGLLQPRRERRRRHCIGQLREPHFNLSRHCLSMPILRGAAGPTWNGGLIVSCAPASEGPAKRCGQRA